MDHRVTRSAKSASLLFLAAITMQPAHVHAETPIGVWFTGGTVSDTLSAYGGAIVSLPGARLGKGLAFRGSVNGGTYSYDLSTGEVDAKYAGAEVAVVYQKSGAWGWANVSAGPRFTHTSLSPDDPGNNSSGSRWDLGLQTDGAFDGPSWRLSWIGSVGPFDGAYEARAQLGRKIGAQKYRIGLEAGIMGNPSYSKGIAGAFAAAAIAREMEFQIGGGVTLQEGRAAKAYGSVGLSQLF